jgi:Fur family zinc uptake transcriptional regulator
VVAFLICETCGDVGEAPDHDIGVSLSSAANSAGFRPKMSVVEITGTCAHCSAQQAAQG